MEPAEFSARKLQKLFGVYLNLVSIPVPVFETFSDRETFILSLMRYHTFSSTPTIEEGGAQLILSDLTEL